MIQDSPHAPIAGCACLRYVRPAVPPKSPQRHLQPFAVLSALAAVLTLAAAAGWIAQAFLRERHGRELAEAFAGEAILLDAAQADSGTRWRAALNRLAEARGQSAATTEDELRDFVDADRLGARPRDLTLVDLIAGRWEVAARRAGEEAARAPAFDTLSLAACLFDLIGRPERAQPLLDAALRAGGGSPPLRAELEIRLGRIESAAGHFDRAQALLAHAVETLEPLGTRGGQATIVALGELEYLASSRGAAALALSLAARRVRLTESQFGADSPLLPPALNNQARYLVGTFKPEAAEPLLRRALAIEERTRAEDATLAWTLAFLGEARRQQRDLKDAETLLTRSIDLLETLAGRGAADLITPLYSLAQTLDARGRAGDAIRLYERAADLERARGSRATPRLATILDRLGVQYFVRGRQREAETALQAAFDFLQARGLLDRPEHCRIPADLARVLLAGTRPELAEAFARRTAAVIDRAPAEFPPSFIVEVRTLLARAILRQGFTEEAEALLRDVVRTSDEQLASDPVRRAAAHIELGNALALARRTAEAEPCYRRALELVEKSASPADSSAAAPLTALGALLIAEGRAAEGTRLLTRAAAIVQRSPGVPPAFSLSLLAQLAHAARTQRDDAAAEQIFSLIILLVERLFGREDPRLIDALTGRAIVRHRHAAEDAAETDLTRAVQIAAAHRARTGERLPGLDAATGHLRDFLRSLGLAGPVIDQKIDAALAR